MGEPVYRTGARLKSQVCDTQVVVVRPPAGGTELGCGGHPMVDLGATADAGLELKPEHALGTQLGKRMIHPSAEGLELLVTKAGQGSLSADGVALALKDAKPLPASD